MMKYRNQMVKNWVLLLSSIILALTVSINGDAQSNAKIPKANAETRGILFGIFLRPESIKLLAEVERLSGKQVREYMEQDSGGETVAFSFIEADGTPFITIRGERGLNEDTIVHELFHLKMIVKGFPILVTCPTPDISNPNVIEYAKFVRANVDNAIQHWMFYPEIRRMGLKPQDGYDKLATVNQSNDWNDLTEFNKREGRILRFFRNTLEINEPPILENLVRWYKSKGWNEELEVGQRMVMLVKNAYLSNPQNVVQIIKRCLKELDRKDFRLEIGRVAIQSRGTYKVNFAYIDIVPQFR